MLTILFTVLCKSCTVLGREAEFVAPDSRIDCHPSPNASKESCEQEDLFIPACYFPRKTGYCLKQVTKKNAFLTNATVKNFYGKTFSQLNFKTTNYRSLLNIRITTRDERRYEPLIDLPRRGIRSKEVLCTISYFNCVRILGGLLFAPKYIQIATYLCTEKIYGFGQHAHSTLMHNLTKYTTWSMFAKDIAVDAEVPMRNLYGVHPFYLALEDDGKAHGVLFWNSNAQEVTLGPAPHLIYRTIGGMLDITFFPGPKPADVIQQYLSFTGKPYLPAYYALGFQISRWGYSKLEEMKTVVNRIKKERIPLDVSYVDIDFMYRYMDFTTGQEKWKGLGDYADELHRDGLHLFLIFDVGIQVTQNNTAFVNAINMNAGFIEWENENQKNQSVQEMYPLVENTNILLGVVWPDWHVAFPDFFNGTTVKWWIQEFEQFHRKIPFDGIWIDMNEPSAFGTNVDKPWYFEDKDRPAKIQPLWCNLSNEWENVPYQTMGIYQHGSDTHLCTNTLCMYARTNNRKNRFYDTKNLYGISQMKATSEALRKAVGKRGALISRSTFVSAGRYGNLWLGDNFSRWPDMRISLISVQEFNMFGFPFVGADICGFIDNTTEELCLRWHQLGAIYPFCRLVFQASLNGATVARPVFFEFPNDKNTHNLGYQVLWGSAMMYIPVTYEKAISVRGYLPLEAKWYSLRDFEYGQRVKSGWQDFSATLSQMIPVFVRAGFILPRQKPEMTTAASRKNPFELLIAPGITT
ncbi:unnamed protein product [Thelazia callipaeda]|uniref:Gal_mutarotas_2 domain-containing protein n=1 Tax=Thelazia callipaeda TaxID=103827 RepID=A0A0N5D5B4_THECL|nr:unnamed protein product [Thelazia callipaeda]